MLLGIKGFGIKEYFKGYLTYSQIDKSRTMTLSIQAKTHSFSDFFNRKNSLKFLSLQIKGKLYIEEIASDCHISGFLKLKYSGIFSVFINFQGNSESFYYLKGGFNPIKSTIIGDVFEKDSNIKVGTIKLLKEKTTDSGLIDKSIFWIK
jgi:hypothetical protein